MTLPFELAITTSDTSVDVPSLLVVVVVTTVVVFPPTSTTTSVAVSAEEPL